MMNRVLAAIAPLLISPLLSPLFSLLLVPGAQAAPTAIATLPLLNITGTGTVKPNLMLLYDNSGSMKSAFTPDYVDDTTSCRAKDTMASSRGCRIGDPPFASADFNKQYYNPKVRYLPPVDAAGNPFKSMTSAETLEWKWVPTDAFNVDRVDLLGNAVVATNLVAGFPDLRWCDSSNNCGYNTAGYAYPDATHTAAQYFFANPYYYTINVAEYCTNATLTNCKVTAVGAPAPSGYPVAAPVRWCDTRALTNCQAKYVGNYKYPRYSDPARNPDFYGTITIGASSSDSRTRISQVQVVTPSGTQVLTNGEVVANDGTNTATRQAAAANALALSIVAKKNTGEQYTACVRVPTLAGVPACSSYGITLDTNNVVAVVPINCATGVSNKSQCDLVTDGSRAGRSLIVSGATNVTALLTVSGTANNNSGKNQELGGVALGGTQLFGSKLQFGRGINAEAVAAAIAGQIGTKNAVRAYVGKTTESLACADAAKNTVCLVADSLSREGQNITLGTLTNNANGKSVYLSFTAQAAVSNGIPTTVTPLGASVFVRTDIVASRDSYPRDAAREDCAGATCTYDEEMTNFANWYAYYKTRNQMMKTAVGQAFRPIGDNYNVGIVALSVAAAEGAMTGPKPFTGAARSSWYSALYAMTGTSSTPIRQALHSVGKMYANRAPYNYASGKEVIQFPCQQNFTFVTTDGYWNGAAAADVVNNDNKESVARFCSRATGCVDPSAQTANSLADVALYWYNGGSNDKVSSLRPTLENWDAPNGNVAAGAGGNTRLHMNTYALGLGVDGLMTYDKDYDKQPESGSDFHKLITGVASGCPWNNNGPWIWPNPSTGDDSGSAAYQSRVDDLWHAAINGHGKYFSASDPLQVIDGLGKALSDIEVTLGAAAAAATSTPNISAEDNDIFAATFTTVRWFGELQGKKINPVDGVVNAEPEWTSSKTLGKKVAAAADSRTILMFDSAARVLKNFKFDEMTAAEQAWFDDKCAQLAQCVTLTALDRAKVNDGANIVNWLRGQQQHADDKLLRAYTMTDASKGGPAVPLPLVLGDVASSKPAYLRDPRKAYPDRDYLDFRTANAGRKATVFVGANDGMLHAFDAADGDELWAYAPRITMKKLYRQASTTYASSHQFTVDGSPEVADVKIGGAWRSVLVGGLNAGGRGYYALDVTDPAAPKALWELCADAAVCSGVNFDADIGLSFGNPQFGTWKDGSGVERWVVFLTSGYNNIKGTDEIDNGSGEGYLYVVDVATGAVLSKTSTGRVYEGSGTGTKDVTATTPSGLARITAISANPNTDPLVTYIYGGDNLGRMWRFDFTAGGAPKLLKMGDAGSSRPVTTRPDVTQCRPSGNAATGTETGELKRVVAFGTGRLLAIEDIGNLATQSAYVLVDKGQTIPDLRATSSMAQQKLSRIAKTSIYTINGVKVDLATQNGWFIDFDQNAGERVNLDPKIVAGSLNVVTNMPSSSSACEVGGTSNVYQVNVCTGEPLVAVDTDDTDGVKMMMVAGQALSNTAAAVGSIVISLPSGELKQITTNADGTMITTQVAAANSEGASRAGWRRVRE
ncbi:MULTISPECIES: pilus assembly protein [unclassified Massilia]|uniref:pilus assembly protein n=1 Tax=unclassified Massilia TaxID=2609279 RepID=UPI001E532D6D|nr:MULTISPECIES: PilC/PilY family type IV pilus protein [unclassified Massilia]